MRDAVYRPEFRHDSTAVSTTAFMTWSATDRPMCLNAATYGEAPSSTEFHGRITTSRKTEPTKKIPIRATTDLVARWTASAGSRLSAAATVTISAPTMEKITTTMAAKTAATPLGKNPPCDVRLEKSA